MLCYYKVDTGKSLPSRNKCILNIVVTRGSSCFWPEWPMDTLGLRDSTESRRNGRRTKRSNRERWRWGSSTVSLAQYGKVSSTLRCGTREPFRTGSRPDKVKAGQISRDCHGGPSTKWLANSDTVDRRDWVTRWHVEGKSPYFSCGNVSTDWRSSFCTVTKWHFLRWGANEPPSARKFNRLNVKKDLFL